MNVLQWKQEVPVNKIEGYEASFNDLSGKYSGTIFSYEILSLQMDCRKYTIWSDPRDPYPGEIPIETYFLHHECSIRCKNLVMDDLEISFSSIPFYKNNVPVEDKKAILHNRFKIKGKEEKELALFFKSENIKHYNSIVNNKLMDKLKIYGAAFIST